MAGKCKLQLDGDNKAPVKTESDFEEHLQRCLSVILHHKEIEQMAEVIKRTKRKHTARSHNNGDET